MRGIVSLFLCACVSGGSTRSKKPGMGDTGRLQGEWLIVSGQRHGETFSDKIVRHVKLIFNGDVLKTAKPNGVTEAKFALHPELAPKGIDLDMDGSLGLGIYKLEGDTLTIVHGEVEEPRPKDFDAVQSGTLNLLVLRKVQ